MECLLKQVAQVTQGDITELGFEKKKEGNQEPI